MIQRLCSLKVARASVQRLKTKLRPMLRRGRGCNLGRVAQSLTRVLRGWVAYYKLAEVKASFEELDGWLRRKLRCIMWRQWKRHRTQFRELCRRGLDRERAARSAFNGRGPWWNAGASHMNHAVPTAELRQLGLLSLLDEYRLLPPPREPPYTEPYVRWRGIWGGATRPGYPIAR
jgi:RNA-directed DNA polymerase